MNKKDNRSLHEVPRREWQRQPQTPAPPTPAKDEQAKQPQDRRTDPVCVVLVRQF